MPGLTEALGRYEILRQLGVGGMATVYLARQVDLDRLVALKELGALRGSDPSFARRFLQEARVSGGLTHSNIVTVHDYFERDGAPYIAMEYLERGSLRPYIARMSLAQIGGVLEGLLAGLAHAEKRGIVHRDLKPENLLVSSDGGVKIADFGIAKATNKLHAGTLLTQTGLTVGTPNYIAPEQAMAQEVGPWSDLYSVGVMAFEFFVGRPPFADTQEPMGIVLRQINEPIPDVRDLVPSTDPWIAAWIQRLVAKEPSERFQSAAAAWDPLEERLIDLLGPRWNRAAPLLEPGEQLATIGAPGGLPPGSSRTTAPLADPMATRTAMPRTQPQEIAVSAGPKKRRTRRWPAVVVALTVAGLVAAMAGALGGRGIGGAGTPRDQVGSKSSQSSQSVALDGLATDTQATEPALDAGNLAEAAKSARSLAGRYEETAAQVARLDVSASRGELKAHLVTALRQAATAYRAVATAADQGDVSRYTSALITAEEHRQAVQQALDEFGGTSSSRTNGDSPSQGSSDVPSSSDESCAGDSASDDPSDDSCEP
jgi:serine/threonine protein kinase